MLWRGDQEWGALKYRFRDTHTHTPANPGSADFPPPTPLSWAGHFLTECIFTDNLLFTVEGPEAAERRENDSNQQYLFLY